MDSRLSLCRRNSDYSWRSAVTHKINLLVYMRWAATYLQRLASRVQPRLLPALSSALIYAMGGDMLTVSRLAGTADLFFQRSFLFSSSCLFSGGFQSFKGFLRSQLDLCCLHESWTSRLSGSTIARPVPSTLISPLRGSVVP